MTHLKDIIDNNNKWDFKADHFYEGYVGTWKGDTISITTGPIGIHNDVLGITDEVDDDNKCKAHIINLGLKGWVSFYIRTTDVTKVARVILSVEDQNLILNPSWRIAQLDLRDSGFYYRNENGMFQINDITPENDTWYHVIIYWNTWLGEYQGLSQGEWKVLIDSTEYGPYSTKSQSGSYAGTVYFGTTNNEKDYTIYISAYNNSESSSYDEEDNLDYDLDWQENFNVYKRDKRSPDTLKRGVVVKQLVTQEMFFGMVDRNQYDFDSYDAYVVWVVTETSYDDARNILTTLEYIFSQYSPSSEENIITWEKGEWEMPHQCRWVYRFTVMVRKGGYQIYPS